MHTYIYINMVPPPHPVVSCSSQTPFPESPSPEYLFMFLGLWESKVSFTMAPEASKFSVCNLFAPEISQNSWSVLEMSLKPTFSINCLWGVMDIVGFTNISNNFHDSRNYGLGPRGFSKFMKLVGNACTTTIFLGSHGNCWFYQHCQQFL